MKTALRILNYESADAKKHGIPFLGNDHYKPDAPKCKEMLECSKTIMEAIKRKIGEHKIELRNGAKVFVEGAPFRNSLNNNIEIFAYRVYEDSGTSRHMEISFKNHLIEEYETKLFKFKITGERR